MMVFTIQRQNERFGPYSLDQVRAMSQAGQLLPMDVVWPEGSPSPTSVGALLASTASDGTGGLIPYKNGPALTSYYLAVASLIPCIGLITGIIALILGLKGLKKVKAEPWVRGTAHAWIGVIGGGGLALLNIIAILWIAISAAMG